MRLLIAALSVVFAVSFFLRPEAGAETLDPSRLELVGGFTELDIARLRLTAVRTQREIRELEVQARQGNGGKERRVISNEIRGLRIELRDHFAAAMSPQQRADLEELARNPRTQRQQLRSRVLVAPDLTRSQHAALERLLAVDQKVREDRPDEEGDQEVERRFWALAGLILAPEQMIAVKQRLPAQYGTGVVPPNFASLPGVNASFGSRVLAAFRNFEAESAATQVQLSQLNQARQASQGDLEVLNDLLSTSVELLERRQSMAADLVDHLNEEQHAAFEAVAPFNRLDQQDQTTRWLSQLENMNSAQRRASVARLTELHRDFRSLQPALEELTRGGVDPEERGGMDTAMAAKNLAGPLKERLLVICRDIALLLDDGQMKAFLTGASEPQEGLQSPNAE